MAQPELYQKTEPGASPQPPTPYVEVPIGLLHRVRETGQQPLHMTWLMLRTLNQQRGFGGWLPWGEALDFLDDYQTRPTSYRHLTEGNNFWWEICKGRQGKALRLTGLSKVLAGLGCGHNISNRVTYVPLNLLNGSVAAKRAALHLGELAHIGRKPRPLARFTIQVRTRITPRTQQRYARLRDPATNRFIVTETKNFDAHAREKYHGSWFQKRYGNTYEVPWSTRRSGKLKVWNSDTEATPTAPSYRSVSPRRYALKAKHARDLWHQGLAPVLLVRRRRNTTYWDGNPFQGLARSNTLYQFWPGNRVSTLIGAWHLVNPARGPTPAMGNQRPEVGNQTASADPRTPASPSWRIGTPTNCQIGTPNCQNVSAPVLV